MQRPKLNQQLEVDSSGKQTLQEKQQELNSLELIHKQQQLIEELENERQNLLAQKAHNLIQEGNEYLEQSNVLNMADGLSSV